MNDEATSNYEDIISQMTLGAKFIYDEFGIRPTVGWHIDPFGHSSGLAQLFADIGFDAFGINRIHYQDKDNRKKDKNLEFVWRGSQSLGAKSDVFTHIMDSHYCSPDECDFFSNSAGENLYWTADDKWFQWDPELPTFKVNVEEKARRFVDMVKSRIQWYDNGNHLIITWGCDFTHHNAFVAYENMDKLIDYVNANSEKFGVRVQYSVFSDYIKAINKYERKWGLYEKDFMPYADRAGAYWTGYYTSRQRLKGMNRQCRNEIATSDILLAYADAEKMDIQKEELYKKILRLKKAHGEFQHHDAITGTEKQAVANDYNVQMADGLFFNAEASSSLLETLSGAKNINRNITITWADLNKDNAMGVILFNNLGWNRKQTVRLVVPTADVEVVDAENNKIPMQIDELPEYSYNRNNGTHALYFTATVPPMGYSVAYIKLAKQTPLVAEDDAEPVIENSKYILKFQKGILKTVTLKEENNRVVEVDGQMYQYASGSRSGAYSFQPANDNPDSIELGDKSFIKSLKGDLLEEVQTKFRDGYAITTRLYKDGTIFENIIELVFDLGPTDGGREIIMRYNTQIKNNKVIFADNNGLEMQERAFVEDASSRVGGNYYPSTQRSYIQDEKTRLTFLEERAHGVASTAEGRIEVMLRRRTINDDGYGVGEALTENDVSDIGLWTLIGDPAASTKIYKTLDLFYSHPIVPFFFVSKEVAPLKEFSLLEKELPANIQLVDFQLAGANDSSYILRFHHLYANKEDEELSTPVTVNVASLFKNLKPAKMTEMQLTGMFTKEQVEKERLVWNYEDAQNKVQELRRLRQDNGLEFTINPMEFKTFQVVMN